MQDRQTEEFRLLEVAATASAARNRQGDLRENAEQVLRDLLEPDAGATGNHGSSSPTHPKSQPR